MKASSILKNSLSFGFVLIFSFIFQATDAQKISLKELWASDSILITPESVHYSESTNLLYVTCIGSSNPSEKDGTGYISLLNVDGTPHNLKWVEGLNAPKGMDIMYGKLYVTDIDQLVVIDVESASIEKKISVENAVFLNDVACDEESNSTYFTDSKTGTVYTLKSGKVSIFYKSEATKVLNGIYNTSSTLYLGSNNLLSLNKETKEIKVLVKNTEQIDGLERIKKDVFIGTNWSGRILGLVTNSPLIILENSQELGYNTADIGINTHKKTIYVPTFFKNNIKAYQYKVD